MVTISTVENRRPQVMPRVVSAIDSISHHCRSDLREKGPETGRQRLD